VLQILSKSVKGLPSCEGPKWGFPLTLTVALTTGQHYRAACDLSSVSQLSINCVRSRKTGLLLHMCHSHDIIPIPIPINSPQAIPIPMEFSWQLVTASNSIMSLQSASSFCLHHFTHFYIYDFVQYVEVTFDRRFDSPKSVFMTPVYVVWRMHWR